MTDPLDAVRWKIHRAHEHLETLQLALAAFMWREPYNTVADLNAEQDEVVVTLVVREEPPKEWGPVFGDFVHNLRSALDHLAIALVRKQSLSADISRTGFPIFSSDPYGPKAHPSAKGRWTGMVKGMTADQIAAIKSMQPFDNPQPPGMIDTLLGLSMLDNADKHFGLTPFTGALGKDWQVEVRKVKDCRLGTFEYIPPTGPLESGAVIARTAVTRTGPNPEVDVRFQVYVGVLIAGDMPDGSVIEVVLKHMATRVLDIVNDFDRRFFR
jgi:hypothetical protein